MITLVFLTFFLTTVLSDPTPPTLSEVFTANVQVYIADPFGNHTGNGVWASDQPNGKNVERYVMSDHTEEALLRYDLQRSFDLIESSGCATHELDGKMAPLWGWVANGTYTQQMINGQSYDCWTFEMGYAALTVAVDAKQNPVWFIRDAPQRTVRINFLSWMPSVSNPTVFDVPSSCPSNPTYNPSHTGVGCVARAGMISRADVWVNAHVPYNQGATYGGYREDCSGYVSMCWDTSKPGYTTFTMPTISKEITKAELQAGDVLLCVTEHVVLFGGWADSAHSQYIAYEETRPGEGTVKRVTPYPYWYNTGCFIPHRYNYVCS